MSKIEKQEVITKLFFQCNTSRVITALSSQARFNPIIAKWNKGPSRWSAKLYKDGIGLFNMIKENDLMRAASVSLGLETEKKPLANKLG